MKKIIYSIIISALSFASYAQSVIIQPTASGNIGVKTGANAIVNNIQIGPTTTPAFIGNDIAIGNSSGGGMSFFQSGASSSGSSIWYSNANHALMPAYGGTGNVGINWTNPVSRLEVYQTGKPSTGFGSYISPMRIGIGVTGSHAVGADNYDAIGVAGFGANASINKRNIGLLGTTDISGGENIGVLAYQNGLFNNSVYGNYTEVTSTGSGYSYGSYIKVNQTTSSPTAASGVISDVTVTQNVSSNSSAVFGGNFSATCYGGNTSTITRGVTAAAYGPGENIGLYASVTNSGIKNLAIQADGNTYLNGDVAIGLTGVSASPKAKLVVTGNNTATNNGYTWFQSGSTALTNLGLAGTFNSIYATHNIVTGAYIGAAVSVTASDNRIKKDFSLSNNSEDLARLRKIEITNYRMKDVDTWGNQTFKKVIAQQVETIYPEVIKRQTSVIPDIYALAEKVVYDEVKKELRCLLSKDYNIKIGEKIELVHPEKGKILSEIVAVSGNTFTVKDWEYATDKIFVFGREVNDFRSVDYEALSMLGISAIQALAKENELLKAKNEKMEARLDAIEVSLKNNTIVPSGK